jgi:hypothetical protein
MSSTHVTATTPASQAAALRACEGKNAVQKLPMKGFGALTLENKDFRRVLYTAKQLQLVVMSLPPGEEIGMERRIPIERSSSESRRAGRNLDRLRAH